MLFRLLLASALFYRASAAYDDSFARKEILYLSAAAYSTTPEQCLRGVIPGAQVTRLVKVDCSISSYAGECAGYVGVAPRQKAIFLVFRGTRGFVQLIVETGQTSLTAMQASPTGGRVSSYFLSVFNKLWGRGLAAGLRALKAKYPTYELWVTGHSLGGALASIGAGLVAKQRIFPSARIRLVTLGQPRTGDAAFAAAIGRLVPETYRVVHGRDIVPHVPPLGFLGYRHHKSEVWYDNEMDADAFYSECSSDGLADCSNPDILNFNALDHVEYFGLPIPGICPNTVVSIF